jgi:TolB protein
MTAKLTFYFVCCCLMLFTQQLTGNAQTSSDGAQIAFVSDRDGNQEIYLMNADGTNPVNLTNNPANDWHPVWSPDGSRLAFTSNRDGDEEIYVMNADGAGALNLTNAPEPDNSPTWSPDGARLAWVSERDGRDIWVMNADGTGVTRITGDGQAKADPAWSPDGQFIAYWQLVGDQTDIYSVDLSNGAIRQLTDDPGNDGWPRWYGGNRIVFDSQRDGNWEVYSMNADGSDQANLSNNPATDGRPDWSNWEWRVAFTTDRDGNSEVYTSLPDGSGLRRLTNHPSADDSPAWRPNPLYDGAIADMTEYVQFTYTEDRIALSNPSPNRWMFLSDVLLTPAVGDPELVTNLVSMMGGASVLRLAPGECVFWRVESASETPTETCREIARITLPGASGFWAGGFQITSAVTAESYSCPTATPGQRTRCLVPR